jgi:hypothetical protein
VASRPPEAQARIVRDWTPTRTTPAPAPSLPVLLAELVELGREAWRISERERAIRAEIEGLKETEENE